MSKPQHTKQIQPAHFIHQSSSLPTADRSVHLQHHFAFVASGSSVSRTGSGGVGARSAPDIRKVVEVTEAGRSRGDSRTHNESNSAWVGRVGKSGRVIPDVGDGKEVSSSRWYGRGERIVAGSSTVMALTFFWVAVAYPLGVR